MANGTIKTSVTVPIEEGGTGATTANEANINLQNYNLRNGTTITSNTDLDTLTTFGIYRAATSTIVSSLVNTPSGLLQGFKMVVMSVRASAYIMQHIHEWGTGNEWKRFGTFDEDVWTYTPWVQVAAAFPIPVGNGGTGATTVDGVKEALDMTQFHVKYVPAGPASSDTITVGNAAKGIIICSGSNASSKGLYIFNTTTSGSFNMQTVVSASDVTISGAAGVITFSNSASSGTIFPICVYIQQL